MPVIDEALAANKRYAGSFSQPNLAMPPSRKLAVLACMDARLHVSQALGIKLGEAHIIRNAGGIVTEDALRSLIISHNLLGTQEFMIINHTDCGMLTFKDDEVLDKLQKSTGKAPVAPARLYSFTNLEDNVRRQIQRVKSHPWIPESIPVRGFIYDVNTGRLSEVRG